MRLGIRAKQIAGVTAIVGLSVVLLSGLAAAMVSNLVMTESVDRKISPTVGGRALRPRLLAMPVHPDGTAPQL